MSKLFGIILIVLFSVTPTFALIISEVYPRAEAYNGDSDIGEWIEIFNDTNETIDLTDGYSLYENTSNRIISSTGEKNILSGEYVIVGQSYEVFINNKYVKDFNGKFFTIPSSSLADSGEVLMLKRNGIIIDEREKYPASSSYEDSLQLENDGSGNYKFVKKKITPGTGNLSVGLNLSNSGSSTTTEITPTFSQPTYYNRYYFPESEKIYLNIGENKIGAVGADILFEGITVNGDKKTVNANYFWSFGDGETGEGKNASHTYKYPGEYTIDGEAYANGYKANARIYVKVVEPNLKIKLKVDEYVEITNFSKEEADIGGFLINNKTLPKKLSILPSKSIKISSETLQLATGTQKVVLRFANGKEIVSDEVILSDHELNKIQDVVNINPASSTNVSVYTKEQFENLQKKPKPNMLKNEVKKLVFKTPKLKQLENHNEKALEDFTKEKFIVKNENKGMLKNILNYFGI